MLFALILSIIPYFSHSAEPLPYEVRTKGYSGWSTSFRGNLSTTNMPGLNIGLASSLLSSLDNPAGLAMTLPTSSMQLTRNSIQDQEFQNISEPLKSTLITIGGPLPPWGFSLSSFSPQKEAGNYILNNGERVNLQLHVSQIQLSTGVHFWDGRLAFGAGYRFGWAKRQITPLSERPPLSKSTFGSTMVFGSLLQLPKRWLIGTSLVLPVTYKRTSNPPGANYIPGFFNTAVKSPLQIGLGVSHVPNRFFKVSTDLLFIGETKNIALLSDERLTVGEQFSFQPRIGAYYRLVEYKDFEIDASLGFYLEDLRTFKGRRRLHKTVATEIHPWIFVIDIGIDFARNYKNYSFSIGLDFDKALRVIGWSKEKDNRDYAGLFPNILHMNEVGLPKALIQDKSLGSSSTNIIEFGNQIKTNVKKAIDKVEDFTTRKKKAPKKPKELGPLNREFEREFKEELEGF